MKQHLWIFLLIVLLCLTGCGKARLDLNIASQPNVNPDNSGRPSPVVVKVYELRHSLAFKQADFLALFENPMPTLGANLIAADELVFVPGEARKISYKPSADTRFVGVVAGFRQMERAQWRVLKPVDPEEKNLLGLEFNDVSILMIPEDQVKNWDPEKTVKEFQQQSTTPEQQRQTQVRQDETQDSSWGRYKGADENTPPHRDYLERPNHGNQSYREYPPDRSYNASQSYRESPNRPYNANQPYREYPPDRPYYGDPTYRGQASGNTSYGNPAYRDPYTGNQNATGPRNSRNEPSPAPIRAMRLF
ncbi:MAG: type VI secretion system lipoprotein TssJ [Desulfovibrio sp.]|jgi:type VI secretion system protein VasD|nr:type VI secretion system lipoprotein TssJ [Desulfovibrio sp.]